MTGHEIRADLAAYRARKRGAAQRAVALTVAVLSPWVAIVLAVRYFW